MEVLEFRRPPKNEESLVGEFTFFCDEFTTISKEYINKRMQEKGLCTYVLEADSYRENLMAIRFPGATRGHIEIDSTNTIIDIVFYDESGIDKDEPRNVGIYKEDIIEAVKQFIGRKIVIL